MADGDTSLQGDPRLQGLSILATYETPSHALARPLGVLEEDRRREDDQQVKDQRRRAKPLDVT